MAAPRDANGQEDRDDEADLYATLNVPRDCAARDVKRAYRRLSVQLHPDKLRQRDPAQYARQTATLHDEWIKVDRAHAVLLDPLLRQIYDEFGPEGLRFAEEAVLKQRSPAAAAPGAGSGLDEPMEVGFHTPASERVLQSVRDSLRERNQNELQARLNASCMLQMDVDVSAWFDGDDEAFYTSNPLGLVELPSLVMQQSVAASLSEHDQLAAAGYVVTRDGLGFGDLQLQWTRTLQPGRMWVQASAAGPFSKAATASVTRVVDHATGMSVKLAGAYKKGETTCSASLGRNLGEGNKGTLECQFDGHDAGVSFEFARTRDRLRSTVALFAQSSLGIRMSSKLQLGDDGKSVARAEAKLSTEAVEVSAGISRRVSKYSRLGTSLALTLTGVTFRLKYKRGETQFVLPFRLSKSVWGYESPWSVVCGALAEGLVYYGIQALVGPASRRARNRVAASRARSVRRQRRSARTQQLMMENRARESRGLEERKVTGLVILQARFGSDLGRVYRWELESIDGQAEQVLPGGRRFGADSRGTLGGGGEDDADSDEEDDVGGRNSSQNDGFFYPPNIDVRVPLQFLVRDSVLRLPAHVSKSRMLGFCDPSIASQEDALPPQLFIRYAFGGRVFEIVVGDGEPLLLPSPAANEVGERYSSTFSTARVAAHEAALRSLREGLGGEAAVDEGDSAAAAAVASVASRGSGDEDEDID